MDARWSIYERLLSEIPVEAKVESCLMGLTWTIVEAQGMGLSMTYRGGAKPTCPQEPYAGRPLVDVAKDIKSWSLREASVGTAAVNAHFNAPETVASWLKRPLEEYRCPGSFTSMHEEMKGKKVAIIGHFPGLERLACDCELSILERDPQPGDLPDFACEYVLPAQDYVLITGTTVINKTLPRLLELCRQAVVVLVGPSVPMAPWWFDLGVDVLAGTVMVNKEAARKHVEEGRHREVFADAALMVEIRRGDVGLPGAALEAV